MALRGEPKSPSPEGWTGAGPPSAVLTHVASKLGWLVVGESQILLWGLLHRAAWMSSEPGDWDLSPRASESGNQVGLQCLLGQSFGVVLHPAGRIRLVEQPDP